MTLDGLDGPPDNLRFAATLTTESGECAVEVWEYNSGLAAFLRAVANDWAGFDGERTYATIEGHLELSCRHDGHGTVTCRVTLGQPWPPEWSMKAVLELGAGAHLERIASDVEMFLGDHS